MLAILRVDTRRHEKAHECFETPYEVFIFMFHSTVFDFHWDEIEHWVRENWPEKDQIGGNLLQFQLAYLLEPLVFENDIFYSELCLCLSNSWLFFLSPPHTL